VGILASRTLETYAGILGACWVGAAYVPINPKLPLPRLKSILDRAGLEALVVDAAGASRLEGVEGIGALRVLGPGVPPACGPVCDPVPMGPSDTGYIMFTSGTTGEPKGVMIGTAGVHHFIRQVQAMYGLGPEDRLGQFSPVSFDFSVLDLFLAWEAGASLHVVPERLLMAPGKFIQEQELTFWASVPSVVHLLDRFKFLRPGVFPTLKATFFCGEALPVVLAEAWQKAAPASHVDNHYGPTEATVACSCHRFTLQDVAGERGMVPIGRAYPGMEMAILDEQGKFLPPGQSGELAISGPQVASGYFQDPDHTAARFRSMESPGRGPGIWYLTGDLAIQDAAGSFHHLGRIDHQIKIHGHRIELEDVDAHLRAVCGSEEAVTVAWPNSNGLAEGLVAFVCRTPLAPAAVMTALKAQLPAYMVPRQVLELESLPRTSNGKVDRKALVSLLDERRHATQA
jgi:amino acid adenylation domain-containing protein